MAKWWEKEPLRFECQADCFRCCVKPGLVYFDRDDIRNASRFLECEPSEFKKAYLTREAGAWVHQVEEGEPCVFLTPRGCGIHEGKPKQCRSYPFWEENLDTKNTWSLAGGFCPGIDRGPMIPVASIKNFLKRFKW